MESDYIKETVRAYDAHPEQYERATVNIVAEQEMSEFIERIPNWSLPILDAGCAFGRDSSLLVKQGLKVAGIDLSEELLARARELNPEITFEKMDVRKLDFPDESFSGIWCNAVLVHLKDLDIELALLEFKRVLTLSGVLFLTFKKGEGELIKKDDLTNDGARYYKYQTLESVTALVENSGLVVDRVYQVNELERWGIERAHDLVHCFAHKE